MSDQPSAHRTNASDFVRRLREILHRDLSDADCVTAVEEFADWCGFADAIALATRSSVTANDTPPSADFVSAATMLHDYAELLNFLRRELNAPADAKFHRGFTVEQIQAMSATLSRSSVTAPPIVNKPVQELIDQASDWLGRMFDHEVSAGATSTQFEIDAQDIIRQLLILVEPSASVTAPAAPPFECDHAMLAHHLRQWARSIRLYVGLPHSNPPYLLEIAHELDLKADAISAPVTEGAAHYGSPLDVQVDSGALVIRIGAQTLAHAVAFSDWANPYDDASGDYIRTFAITDVVTFARDVRAAMLREEEDGSSPLSDFLDEMTEAAVEDGSTACECEQRIKHGETASIETWARPSGTEGAPE